MVSHLTGLRDSEPRCGRPRVIEVVGPAGAGKTTLYRAILQAVPEIQSRSLPDVHDAHNHIFFTKHILILLPTLFRLHIRRKEGKGLSRRQLAWMAMLNGWPELLAKTAVNEKQKGVLLDQGPLFLISTLIEFGPLYLQSIEAREWWTKIYGLWANTLDMVIYLDTSDDILIRRICTRPEDHMVKRQPEGVMVDFLSRYRSIYHRVINRIESHNSGIRVLRYDSGQCSVGDLVHTIASEIAETCNRANFTF